MISGYLSLICSAIGNHLWQCTVFAAVTALLILSLHNHRARARYWIWFAASLKFLIPFSLLVGVGTHLAWSHAIPRTTPALYVAMTEFGQPFTPPTMSLISPANHVSIFANFIHLFPAALVGLWLCGFVAVVVVRYTRWRRISAAMREATPLREGREPEILRRLERLSGMRNSVELRFSAASLEPGVFGIARPVLVWPKQMSARLEDAQLEAVLAHELCHVRWRDNFAAAMHMLVEALFWLYPPVWWIGARLLEERERACDEEVLEFGANRQVYAESILKICKFCVESPLTCVSGVTGADLKKRIARIMTERLATNLSPARKFLLASTVVVATVGPILLGLFQAPQLRAQSAENRSESQGTSAAVTHYDMISVKRDLAGRAQIPSWDFSPDGFTASNVTLQELIEFAHGVQDYQISGAPTWVENDRWTVDAKLPSSVADQLRELVVKESAIEQREECRAMQQPMLQGLLADRFKLIAHRETKTVPVYVLTENGPKIQKAKPGDTYPDGMKDLEGQGHGDIERISPGLIIGQGVPVYDQNAPWSGLVNALTFKLDRPVLNETSLKGDYDYTLHWRPEDPSSIFTAIQEQLGLRLEPQDGPVEFLVLDHVEQLPDK